MAQLTPFPLVDDAHVSGYQIPKALKLGFFPGLCRISDYSNSETLYRAINSY